MEIHGYYITIRSAHGLHINIMTSGHNATTMPATSSSFLPPEELELEQLTGIIPTKLTLRESAEHRTELWIEKLRAIEGYDVTGCLKRHEVSPEKRASMVNWILEITKRYECSDLTFFKAVAIMDLFYSLTKPYIFGRD